ncbi:MAG: biotin/lipoyl-binding carrier protein [Syntrophomonadaceae bacterium]|nr:biotin/lipoyl-binding carrier protein [Syntrophomonadaceae bacterium]
MAVEVEAPMVGKIFEIAVEVGAKVEEDDEIIVLESMKMENPIFAPASGTVKEIKCKVGDVVNQGDVLAIIE